MLTYITRIWYNKKIKIFYYIILSPFEFIFKIIVLIRKNLYKYNILKSHKFNIPVIVVGNITVGGTGKTPLVIYIANYLKNLGYNPGIISRGYKSLVNGVNLVTKDLNPIIFGDEPVLLANATNCSVVIGKDRVATIKYLLKNFNNINIIISDDGLQHYKLKRDLEIAVIDGYRQFGNEHLLPLGPLREPISRLETVDIVVSNDKQVLDYKYIIKLVPNKCYNLIDPNNIADITKFNKVHAVAGIGNNQRFFDLLKNLGLQLMEHSFPDHYNFKPEDLNFFDDLPIIMTEKDAVKCAAFAKNNFWCQTVIVKINLEQEFNSYLINKIKTK